jgi:Transposase DDE domain group 1
VARFDTAHLCSDGGLLALREIENRLGIAWRLAACSDDPRAPDKITQILAEIIRFRILTVAAGYEDGNDADALRRDPMSSWPWSGCRKLPICAHNPPFRAPRTCPTRVRCCAWDRP